jgi:hypothetical protein
MKTVKILCVLAVAAGIFLYFNFSDFTREGRNAFTTIVTGSEADKYQGQRYYENENTQYNRITIDLGKIKGSEEASPSINSYYWTRPVDGKYAVQTAQGSLRLVNLSTSALETYKYPDIPGFSVNYSWVGKELVLHYFSAADGSSPERINAATPRIDHFYSFNPEQKKFSIINADMPTSEHTSRAYQTYFLKKSDSEKYFVVAYCTDTNVLGECSEYGISISNGAVIKKLLEAETDFTWGWDGKDFFAKTKGKAYVIDLTKIDWQ